MSEINNAADWWKAVDDEWDHLTAIIFHRIDPHHPAHETPGDPETPKTGRTILAEVEHLRVTRDVRLARYFHAAWGMASEAYAWSVPGWGTLCDLCSEDWAIHPEALGYDPCDVPPVKDTVMVELTREELALLTRLAVEHERSAVMFTQSDSGAFAKGVVAKLREACA